MVKPYVHSYSYYFFLRYLFLKISSLKFYSGPIISVLTILYLVIMPTVLYSLPNKYLWNVFPQDTRYLPLQLAEERPKEVWRFLNHKRMCHSI